MTTVIKKWGNSQGLRLSKGVLEDAGLAVGDVVDLVVQDGVILLKPIRRIRGRLDLRKLVARIPKGYRPAEEKWGPPMGNEVW